MKKTELLIDENRYRDTRDNQQDTTSFSEAVVRGIAPGGGLYVPENLPHYSLDTILSLAQKPYHEQAAFIYKSFGVDLPDETIDELMTNSYGDNFDTPAICPLTKIDENTTVLELWHGPTSAFKDMALQCLPRVFSACAQKLKNEGVIETDFLFLVATSGDTGKAALEGFKDVDGVSIAVMFPEGGVSDIQRKQMVTQTGNNVQVWGVRGNFDDCQTGAKQVFSDSAFNDELAGELKTALTSANSINWGRLMPQIVYYVSAYSRLVAEGSIQPGDQIDICVPTGNFGNILAAWYAKQMGTPIHKLFCASNENRVLTDFIETGVYDISDRELTLTAAPSMDILVSSNLERLLYELTDRNGEQIKQWMADLKQDKRFEVDAATLARIKDEFSGAAVSNDVCLTTIKDVFDAHDYLVDPHTAIACKATEELRGEYPVLIVSTAHWAKFGNNVFRALNVIAPNDPLPPDMESKTGSELNNFIAEHTHQDVPRGLAILDELPIRFTEVIDGDCEAIEEAVTAFLQAQKNL